MTDASRPAQPTIAGPGVAQLIVHAAYGAEHNR